MKKIHTHKTKQHTPRYKRTYIYIHKFVVFFYQKKTTTKSIKTKYYPQLDFMIALKRICCTCVCSIPRHTNIH